MPYIPHTQAQVEEMLRTIGARSIEELFGDIPAEVRFKGELRLPGGLSEKETWDHLAELAEKNCHSGQYTCFLGAGSYQHYQPKAVKHLLSRSEFYTAYTPYQPEISQGILQAIFEYQTMICELTGMDAANASVYDGATAVSDAALMAAEATRRRVILVSSLLHPEYRQTMRTYLRRRGLEIKEIPWEEGLTSQRALEKLLDKDVAGVAVQNPNFLGSIEPLHLLAGAVHEAGSLLIACVDPVSLGLIESPGKLGADIAVGEGQSLGLPMSYGGPHLGFMAVKENMVRRLPGRIVGKTRDKDGREGFVLTLQAREQHIRREKAGSNICSNQALCALAATIYLALMGPVGLSEVGRQCRMKSNYAMSRLEKIPGVTVPFSVPVFKEFVVRTQEEPQQVNKRLWKAGILGGLDLMRFYPELSGHILLCVTEMRTYQEIDKLIRVWEGTGDGKIDF
ncbi:MAG: aminomethyl-transferring glycine dehydrogenase subunit GcvPA [Peptococcaceae bacterium]|nr:aminomethyl-transferring glycine dehydrogenase subunit GcvPA [Peptococcaceae bacterium]